MNADHQCRPVVSPAGFDDIRRRYTADVDYRIVSRSGRTGALVMAPHGGSIEPGTHIIADAVAGPDHAYYAFLGIRPANNRTLHLPSTRFDEPRAIGMAERADLLVVIHGCRHPDRVVFLGGLDAALCSGMARWLAAAGFRPAVSDKYPGRHPRNLCNRFPGVRGVQMELSTVLRDHLVGTAGGEAGDGSPAALDAFCTAVRGAIGAAGNGRM